MSFGSHLAKPVLLLALVGLGMAMGCQQQPATDRRGDKTAKTKQVTVAVSGMT